MDCRVALFDKLRPKRAHLPPPGGHGTTSAPFAHPTTLFFGIDFTETAHRLNTNSMEAVEVFFSSGENGMTFWDWREPTRTAMYCLPFTA